MVQKSQTTTWDGAKTRKYWDKLPTSTGFHAGFLNHQQYDTQHPQPTHVWPRRRGERAPTSTWGSGQQVSTLNPPPSWIPLKGEPIYTDYMCQGRSTPFLGGWSSHLENRESLNPSIGLMSLSPMKNGSNGSLGDSSTSKNFMGGDSYHPNHHFSRNEHLVKKLRLSVGDSLSPVLPHWFLAIYIGCLTLHCITIGSLRPLYGYSQFSWNLRLQQLDFLGEIVPTISPSCLVGHKNKSTKKTGRNLTISHTIDGSETLHDLSPGEHSVVFHRVS